MSEQHTRNGGRPAENRFFRQLEIFEAVVPLLRLRGARALTLRDAAAACHMSVGGLNPLLPHESRPAVLAADAQFLRGR